MPPNSIRSSSGESIPAKRYVLFLAGADLSAADKKELWSVVERRQLGTKLIEVEGNPKAVILKTTNAVAPSLRSPGTLALGGKALTAVLTSGAIGNLKKRAIETAVNGQVHE